MSCQETFLFRLTNVYCLFSFYLSKIACSVHSFFPYNLKFSVSHLITLCVSRRRRKMYCGHARLCVCLCLSVCPRPDTRRAAAFWTAWSRLICPSAAPVSIAFSTPAVLAQRFQFADSRRGLLTINRRQSAVFVVRANSDVRRQALCIVTGRHFVRQFNTVCGLSIQITMPCTPTLATANVCVNLNSLHWMYLCKGESRVAEHNCSAGAVSAEFVLQ